MREIRIHGRGGQGAVIASKLLAEAFFREGHHVQSFPAFGVERRGAPVTAFVRISRAPILLRCEITTPDELIVLDPTLVEAVDVTTGLRPGGPVLLSSERPPDAYPLLCSRYALSTVDAGDIASRHGLGTRAQPIVNTAILGAFAAAGGGVSLETVCQVIRDEAPGDPEPNIAAAREAASQVRRSEREPVHV